MHKPLLATAVALALVCSLPASAQTQTIQFASPPAVTGTLTTTGDVVQIDTITGGRWATASWSVIGTAGTATAIIETSNDGGTNWIPAPASKRINFVTGNPTFTVPGGGFTPATGNVWETPLQSNTTNFRLRCGASGTTNTIQISAGTPYVPGMPVVGVLYDSAVTAGANNNTPTIDVTGWRQVTVSIVVTTAATGAASLNIVDDAGAAVAVGTSASIAVGTFVFGWGDSGTFGTANPFTMVGGVTALPLDRRFNIAVAGATTSATRVRVVARR